MSQFHVETHFARPGLHVWREGTGHTVDLTPASPPNAAGWTRFEYDMEPGVRQRTRFLLFDFNEVGAPGTYEPSEHQRVLPRRPDSTYPDAVWAVQGANRVLTADPAAGPGLNRVTVHLLSQTRYRPSQLYLWVPETGQSRRVDQTGIEPTGPYFQLDLTGAERRFFLFKFIRRDDDGQFTRFEPDFANRLWSSADGAEVWTHSEAAVVLPARPTRKTLRVHFRQGLTEEPRMRYWQENSDYVADVVGTPAANGWTVFPADLYTDMAYGFQFWNPDRPEASRWEHPEARRDNVQIQAVTDVWTLEGDSTVFRSRPEADRRLDVHVAVRPPFSALGSRLFAHTWVNRARAPLGPDAAVGNDGRVTLRTYPDVLTSVKFRDDAGRWESVERHTVRAGHGSAPTVRHAVLERAALLEDAPPADLFRDPPFTIRRPGADVDGGEVRFVLHAPSASRMRVIGEWTGWESKPVEMRSTRDGSYWWASVPTSAILTGLGGASPDYHGAKYQYLFNDHDRYQDPAAGWVESSWNQAASRLIRPDRFPWTDGAWGRPGWESLVIYQLHPARFSNRFQNEPPLRRVAREVDSAGGYLRDLGVTALQLMPVNEVGTQNSWGYDPAFFYAIENDLGGPDALKELVDVCHSHGLAVLLDVVFNHAGNVDNILWEVARDSYFDGDTAWGAMINFDHPQCRHFFAQNLAYLAREFHIDGFRLDHTATIIHSAAWDPWSGFVRKLGSGGGWEFLHAIRTAVKDAAGANCVLIAEHLPNEWAVTNYGGPMDSQWCDDFHDRMVDACRRQFGMSRLADAYQLSQTACDNWYKVTNYPESHDEVGNVRDRVAFVAGWGQGLRMSKVAAAGSLLARGIPMYFMGAESAEDAQFAFGSTAQLPLDFYLSDPDRQKVRAWWREMANLHRDSNVQGPSPLGVAFADEQTLAFTRGARADLFVVLNFGGWSGWLPLDRLNLPDGTFRELWNSTWPAFAVGSEQEGEHANGGRDARLNRSSWLNLPDYGAVVLQRTD